MSSSSTVLRFWNVEGSSAYAAIGVLRNQLYAGIVDVPEYGVRGKRGDFRAHPDFPLRGFVRCKSCGCGLTDLLTSLGGELLLWDLSELGWFEKKPVLQIPLDRTKALAFAGSRLVTLEPGRVRIFDQEDERVSFEAPFEFDTPWAISHDGTYLCVGGNQAVCRFDLVRAAFDRAIVADILRPERVPSWPIAQKLQIRGGAMLWRTQHGYFLHQSDGPRGRVEPLDLSPDGFMAIPCKSGRLSSESHPRPRRCSASYRSREGFAQDGL